MRNKTLRFLLYVIIISCILCSCEEKKNCTTCSVSTNKCDVCQQGYYPNGENCDTCQSQNCSKCDVSYGTCTECISTDFFVNTNNKCETCKNKEHCLICNSIHCPERKHKRKLEGET